jgi:hypothetical protein
MAGILGYVWFAPKGPDGTEGEEAVEETRQKLRTFLIERNVEENHRNRKFSFDDTPYLF